MRKSQIIWIVLLTALLVVAGVFYFAARSGDRLVRISSNPWVGFTPFIYAQEKGWLEDTPFRFMWLVDLSDNARLYERGFTQGFTATQYELLHFKNAAHIRPVFLIDRSAGADAILSNLPLEALRKTLKPITVYLELGSLNEDFFQAFVKENKLEGLQFVLTNSSQKAIAQLNPNGGPVIVISYAPYASELARHGFVEIASTATLKSFFVIDALFVDERAIVGREHDYKALQKIFNRAQKALSADPQEYYTVIHKYLEGQSYEEFIATTRQVEWMNGGDKAPFLRQFQSQNIKTDMLLP